MKKGIILAIAVAAIFASFWVGYKVSNNRSKYEKGQYEHAITDLYEFNADLNELNTNMQDSIQALSDLLKQDSATIAELEGKRKAAEQSRDHWYSKAQEMTEQQVDSFLVARYGTDSIEKKVVTDLIGYDHLSEIHRIVLKQNEALKAKVNNLESVVSVQDSIINNQNLKFENLQEIVKLRNQELEEAWDAADKAKRNTVLVGASAAGFVVLLLIAIAL